MTIEFSSSGHKAIYNSTNFAKYGEPGVASEAPEGFDARADSVGPGIYGGIVKRDSRGIVQVEAQFGDHNPRPGAAFKDPLHS